MPPCHFRLHASLPIHRPLALYETYSVPRQHSTSCDATDDFCVACALESHITTALERHSLTVAPNAIVKNLKRLGRSFKLGRQEDSHEFMRCLLEALQSAWPRAQRLARSLPPAHVAHE